jgi:DNA topoisomerase I
MSSSPAQDEAPAAPVEGLRYVTDAAPGIRRRRRGAAFAYYLPSGERLRDAATLKRIAALAIPPAYRDVWISTNPAGHLQATGRDARGRKQYRYHPLWRGVRDAHKYDRMREFGAALPRVRRRVTRDLKRPGIPREKVLAAVVKLLESTLIRVGNEQYARSNGSYGLTTLRSRHVDVSQETIRFEFRGKHGKIHRVVVSDSRLARVVRRCRDLPGQELFQYLDEQGTRHAIESSDVNKYLREASGGEFTAKDFRTWFGTLAALEALQGRACGRPGEAKRSIASAIQEVSERLGNTPTMCRKCYIHPTLIDAFLSGRLPAANGHSPEQRLLQLLGSRPRLASRRRGRRGVSNKPFSRAVQEAFRVAA